MFGRWKKTVDGFEILDGDFVCIKRRDESKQICQLRRDQTTGDWTLFNHDTGEPEISFTLPDVLVSEVAQPFLREMR